MEGTKILYIVHYGQTEKIFYCDLKTGKPKKVIGDGGSNIHIHLIQYLIKQKNRIVISTFQNNYQYLAFFKGIPRVKFTFFWTPKHFLNIYKIFCLPIKAPFLTNNYDFIISASDFFPDVFYASLIKIIRMRTKWIASYFLDAPPPWSKSNPYRQNIFLYLKGILYWLVQRFSYQLVKRLADFVLVTSEPDVDKFITRKRDQSKIIVVQGGVDITLSTKYLKEGKIKPPELRKYDACFLGRLHYQKGCLELIDIWKIVADKKLDAKLIMIGNGPLKDEVKSKIKQLGLEKNIVLYGFQYGEEKYELFKESKIMVHPATYDSGGMSSAEGMAWGLPAVSFDLESLKTYYPKGMIKTELGDNNKFAENILKLLENKKLYGEVSRQARDLIVGTWDWNERLQLMYNQIFL